MLEVRDLSVGFPTQVPGRLLTVLQGVNLSLADGEALGLVGESGSGKSMTVRSILRLLPRRAVTTGDIRFRGKDVMRFGAGDLTHYRGHDTGTIFQDPRAHINPLQTIGSCLTEAVICHKMMSKDAARKQAIQLLYDVGIRDPERRLAQYPHQLSGGLLQRVMIVAALMTKPSLLLADEISTALDVTVQSDVMAILNDLRRDQRLGMIFITHDLDLAAAVTDRLAVMYAGTVVEAGKSSKVIRAPKHPYTAALMASRPSLTEVRKLTTIPGRPISASEAGVGCVFATRCRHTTELCRTSRPLLKEVGDRQVACHLSETLTLASEATL